MTEKTTERRQQFNTPLWGKLAGLGLGVLALTYLLTKDMGRQAALQVLGQIPVVPPVYTPSLIYGVQVPEQEEPKQEAPSEAVGARNIAEFLMEDLIARFQETRRKKAAEDPGYVDRINPRFLPSNSFNILLLGTDETRERFDQFSGQGWGRADIIMLLSFDPHTFNTLAISLPRDLFVPGWTALKLPESRANTVTLLTQVDPSADPLATAARIMEGASGMPVDMVMQGNLDLAQGYPDINDRFRPGIFDTLFPEGLQLYVPKEINDPAYPVGYGIRRLRFLPGEQVLDGKSLVAYSRTRVDFDFGRNDRQRAVAGASARRLLQMVRGELFWGQTTTLDTLAKFLLQQRNEGNLFSDVAVPEIITTVSNHLALLRSNPQGMLALATLALNSPDLTADSFRSLGLSRVNGMVTNVEPWENHFFPNTLKLAGSRTTVLPNEWGNYHSYWQPLRAKVEELWWID